MESPSNGDMSHDILLEILLRLPMKTLLQFKCICKRWYSLIKSPSFINQHFLHKSNQECLLVRHYRPDLERYAFALYVDEIFSRYEEPDHLQIPYTASTLMGPLNGVFCAISISGRCMALLNPSLKQFKPLPLFNLNVQSHLSHYDNLFGFGLDPLSGDYKVVAIKYFWNEEIDSPHYPRVISVYTSGSDSWRHFDDVALVNSSRCAYRSLSNTYLNGFYYWIAYNDTHVAVLLAFDMRSEIFSEIQLPDCIRTKEADLTLYRDSLALLMTCDLDATERCFDVWIMEKNGSWNKRFRVGPFEDIRWPLGFWKDNELLIETENCRLALYNVCTRKLRTLGARRKENGLFLYWVFSYKESLFSLGDKCKMWDTSSDFVKNFFK